MTAQSLEKTAVVVTVAVLGVALGVVTTGAAEIPLAVALMLTVSAGIDLIMRSEARHHPSLEIFILPNLLILAALLFLPLLPSGAAIAAGLVVFGGLLFALVWAEHNEPLVHTDPRVSGAVRGAILYLVAFLLFAAIYQSKARTLISAPTMVGVTLLLAARLLRIGREDAPRRSLYLYGVFVALAVGEVTWALNYWPLNGLFGGAFLLGTFYFLVGILDRHLAGRLNTRTVLEYSGVCLAGVLLLAAAGLLRPS